MVRALVLTALICVCCSLIHNTEARWTIRPRPTRTTTTTTMIPSSTAKMTTQRPTTTTTTTTLRPRPRPKPTKTTTTTKTPSPISIDLVVDDKESEEDRYYHPAEVKVPRLIEQYDSRALDGHYEYRYVLSNGDTRYERAYWLPVGHKKVLARKGYYSYPLPNHEFMTVFYTADHQGYHQDSSTFSKHQPVLPRSIIVPEYEPPKVNVNEQHGTDKQHSHKPNKGHGRKPTTKTVVVSQTDVDLVDENTNLQDVVVVKATDVTPTTMRAAAAASANELQLKLRKQHANDEVSEFVPVTTDFTEILEVVEEEQQQQQQQEQQLHHHEKETVVGETLQEAAGAVTTTVDI